MRGIAGRGRAATRIRVHGVLVVCSSSWQAGGGMRLMLSSECWVHASCARKVGSLVWAMDDNLDRALRASKRLWALRRALTAGRSGRSSHSC
jgi:hypothetical protein